MFRKEKYIKEETQFLIDIFIENERKRTFLENFVKDYNAKKKNIGSRNYTNSKKVPWVLNIGPKIRRAFKKVNKNIIFTSGKYLQNIQCQNNPKCTSTVVYLECTSWIVHTMVDILANQKENIDTLR